MKKAERKKTDKNKSVRAKAKPRGKPYEKGNQFWKIRAKSGRDRIFADAQTLLEEAENYFQWCDNNPLIEIQFMRGKEGIEKLEVPKMRVYLLSGLCIYLGVNVKYFIDFKIALEKKGENMTEMDRDFSQVIAYIEHTIYSQKFSGASSGFFNPLIISRDLGLREQVDNKTEASVTVQGIEYIVPEKQKEEQN